MLEQGSAFVDLGEEQALDELWWWWGKEGLSSEEVGERMVVWWGGIRGKSFEWCFLEAWSTSLGLSVIRKYEGAGSEVYMGKIGQPESHSRGLRDMSRSKQ